MSRISLCMIVKDEQQNIARCLQSVVNSVDELIIVDTGSGDQTLELARKYGAIIRTFPWQQDFSAARNVSLDLAGGEWILILDADEELYLTDPALLYKLAENSTCEGYFFKIINFIGLEGGVETCPDLVFRFFRNRPEYRFQGAIHEQIAEVIQKFRPEQEFLLASGVEIRHYGYLDEQIAAKHKKERNLQLLAQEVSRHANDFTLRYHYGVELYRNQRYAEAIQEFESTASVVEPSTLYLPKLWRYLALSYLENGQIRQALHSAEAGLRLFPNYADLYYLAGLTHLDLQAYGLARYNFNKALSAPEQPLNYASFAGMRGFRVYFQLGRIAEIFRDEEEALRLYLQALRENPDFLPALEQIIKLLQPRRYPDYTENCLAKAFDLTAPRALQAVAEICFKFGGYGLALNYWQRLQNLEEYPAADRLPLESYWHSALPCFTVEREWQIGICLLHRREYAKAQAVFNRLVAGGVPSSQSTLLSQVKLHLFLISWLQGETGEIHGFLKDQFFTPEQQDMKTVLDFIAGGEFSLASGSDWELFFEFWHRLLALEEKARAMTLFNRIPLKAARPHLLTFAKFFREYGWLPEACQCLQASPALDLDPEAKYLLAECCLALGDRYRAEYFFSQAVHSAEARPEYLLELIRFYENWPVRQAELPGTQGGITEP